MDDMDGYIIEWLPGFINELNELTLWGLLGLVVVYLIVREVMRARYRGRTAKKVAEKLEESDMEDTFTRKPVVNPHPDPTDLTLWLAEEHRHHRSSTEARLNKLEQHIAELRVEMRLLRDGGMT